MKVKLPAWALPLLVLASAAIACDTGKGQPEPTEPPSTTITFNPRVLPACPEEDSPGPCYWDAHTKGNGVGRSFWVDENQNIHYLTN